MLKKVEMMMEMQMMSEMLAEMKELKEVKKMKEMKDLKEKMKEMKKVDLEDEMQFALAAEMLMATQDTNGVVMRRRRSP